MPNMVYIATSLDGYIADKDNKVDWLHDIPNPSGSDMGFTDFMQGIDALIMGRKTLDIVLSFDCDWPYTKPVYVLSNTLTSLPAHLEGKVFLLKGDIREIVQQLNSQGMHNLYIDGGTTIQSFLAADLIDKMIITSIPVLLGAGIPLFGELASPLKFKHLKAERHLDCLVSNTYIRQR